MSTSDEAPAQEHPAMMSASGMANQVVDHNYLNLTEQRLLQEAERQEQAYQQFRANNSSAMNVIRLARLGLIASEQQSKEMEEAGE